MVVTVAVPRVGGGAVLVVGTLALMAIASTTVARAALWGRIREERLRGDGPRFEGSRTVRETLRRSDRETTQVSRGGRGTHHVSERMCDTAHRGRPAGVSVRPRPHRGTAPGSRLPWRGRSLCLQLHLRSHSSRISWVARSS